MHTECRDKKFQAVLFLLYNLVLAFKPQRVADNSIESYRAELSRSTFYYAVVDICNIESVWNLVWDKSKLLNRRMFLKRLISNTIRFVLLMLIHWIVTYPVNSIIQPWNNRGQDFNVVSFSVLCKLVITYKSANETPDVLVCGHSNESYLAALLCGIIGICIARSVR